MAQDRSVSRPRTAVDKLDEDLAEAFDEETRRAVEALRLFQESCLNVDAGIAATVSRFGRMMLDAAEAPGLGSAFEKFKGMELPEFPKLELPDLPKLELPAFGEKPAPIRCTFPIRDPVWTEPAPMLPLSGLGGRRVTEERMREIIREELALAFPESEDLPENRERIGFKSTRVKRPS